MRNTGGGIGILWAVLAGVILLVTGVFVLLLGPERSLRIALAAASSTAIDGLSERSEAHRIPVLALRVDPAWLDSLNADLPWSGGLTVPATLIDNGMEHPARLRYRGVVTPSHYLGGKRSIRISLKGSNPFAPYRRLNLLNPKAMNLVNNHLALWVGGRMGVPVPWDEMVFVRLNGKDHGVMELCEQIDGRFERSRHLSGSQVPVFKGDFAPVEGRELPAYRSLWRSSTHWEYVSKADSTAAIQKLAALIDVVADTLMSNEQRRDTLSKLVDVEAFLRYSAALLLLNTAHVDQYHNQWLVLNPRTDRFYPVLWDALLLYQQRDPPLYCVHDALAYWLLRDPVWRLERDKHAYSALKELHTEAGFKTYLDHLIDRIRPSVLRDRNKTANVTFLPEDVHRFSWIHYMRSTDHLRQGMDAHWTSLLDRFSDTEVHIVRSDTSIVLRSASEVPFRVSWQYEGPDMGKVAVDGMPVQAVTMEGLATLVIHREVLHSTGSRAAAFADRQHFTVQALDVVISFPQGVPTSLLITNAITNEAVQ